MLQPRLTSYFSQAILLAAGISLSLMSSVSEAQLGSKLRQRDYSKNTLNFEDITSTNLVQVVAEIPTNEKEVEFGDVDRDGDLDVLIVTARSFSFSGRRRNKLYINTNGVLREESQLVVGPGPAGFTGFDDFDIARNGFLRDYDGDGWLDILVICDRLAGADVGTTRLFMNQHDGGVFTGFKDMSGPNLRNGTANGAACGGYSADFDQDGDEDFWLGNYPGPSQDEFELNDGTGKFTRAASNLRPSDSDYTVDVCAGDINGDGMIDVFVSNETSGDDCHIYYNNLNNAGSGVGDFEYPGSKQTFTHDPNLYPAFEPGDFNRDGKLDLYFANRSPGGVDTIMVNQGNDASGKATFNEIVMPGLVSNSPTAKITASDLNGDGRLDLIVMGGSTSSFGPDRRPVIFRNTSVNGQTSFVAWTPGHVFPSTLIHSGWHAAAFDVDGDKRKDVLVGAMDDDFLFKSVPSPVSHEKTLAGSLPSVHNQAPQAISGKVSPKAPDNFSGNLPSGAIVSAVLRSSADVILEVRNSSGTVIASSDRGSKGVEEALQFTAPGGDVEFRVSSAEATPSRSGDGYFLEINSRSN